MANNLVEAYLKKHPTKRRPKEDLEELDKKNKINKDSVSESLHHVSLIPSKRYLYHGYIPDCCTNRSYFVFQLKPKAPERTMSEVIDEDDDFYNSES